MIHTYSLIHDDLPAMDDDSLRRGQPTLHVVAGDAMAILAGDALQAEAFSLLAREPASSDPDMCRRKIRVVALIAAAAGAGGMVGGQAIDIDAVRPGPRRTPAPMSPADVQTMHSLKTGALIRAAAAAGAVMAGADEPRVAAIDAYAREVGLAFQIVDDILDVEAASSTLGKTAGKDARAGKPTYPSLFGLEHSRTLAADACHAPKVTSRPRGCRILTCAGSRTGSSTGSRERFPAHAAGRPAGVARSGRMNLQHGVEHAMAGSGPQPLDQNGRPASMIEDERCRSPRRSCLVASALSRASLRAQRSNPRLGAGGWGWIASLRSQ